MGEWKEKKNRAPDLKYLERESLKKGDSDTGTAADVELVMKKYDRESNTRVWQGKPASIIRWLSVLFSVYSIYVTLFSTALPEIRLSMFLGMILILGYLHYPIQKGDGRINHMPWYDWVLMAVGAVPFFYFAANAHAIIKLATRVTKNPVMVLMAILAVAVVIVIVTFVLPQFSDLFSTMDSLPGVTLALMAFSGFMVTKWYLIILGVAAVVMVIRSLLRIPAVRLEMDRRKLKMPVFGPLNQVICTARFARTISSLYSSGLPIVTALQTARDTIGNAYIVSQFNDVLVQVRSGVSLSAALETVDGFQRKLCSSIAVGEETGRLDSMLDSIADSMEYDAQQASKRMMTILEPMLIVLMAFVVGFIIIAVMSPIIGSYSAIESSGNV